MFNYGRPPRRVITVRYRPSSMRIIRMGISVIMIYKRSRLGFIVQRGVWGGEAPHRKNALRRWGWSAATRPHIDKKNGGLRGAKPPFCRERSRKRPRKFLTARGNFPVVCFAVECLPSGAKSGRTLPANFSPKCSKIAKRAEGILEYLGEKFSPRPIR